MKTRITLSLMVLVGALALALPAAAQVATGPHDMRTELTLPDDNMCYPCHAVHAAQQPTEGPLWDHDVQAPGAYLPYLNVNGTLDAVVGAPGPTSVLCLGCHDGTIAVDAFGHDPAPPATVFVDDAVWGAAAGEDYSLGVDLAGSHPIGFVYDTLLSTTDGELVDPSSVGSSGLGGTIDEDMLFLTRVECASCHEVHDSAPNLLLIANTDSALCLTCHIK